MSDITLVIKIPDSHGRVPTVSYEPYVPVAVHRALEKPLTELVEAYLWARGKGDVIASAAIARRSR